MMIKRFLLLPSLFLVGCVSPERALDYSRLPHHPPTLKDNNLLKRDLKGSVDVDVVGKSGSLWRVDVLDPSNNQTRVHWLILYPDGKCLISLRGWKEEWDDSPTEFSNSVRAEIFERHQQIIYRLNPAAIMEAYKNLVDDGYYRAPMMGRYVADSKKIEINALERDPREFGASLFESPPEGVAVSRFSFIRTADMKWALSQSSSYTIWHPNEALAEYLLGTSFDRPALKSIRHKIVSLNKIEGFKPPSLPAGWEW